MMELSQQAKIEACFVSGGKGGLARERGKEAFVFAITAASIIGAGSAAQFT
jgi:hypothetical protein